MSKIGSLVFDLQEQGDAEFLDGHVVKQYSESLVSEFVALFAAHDTYQSVLRLLAQAQGLQNKPEKFRTKPVVADLNTWN